MKFNIYSASGIGRGPESISPCTKAVKDTTGDNFDCWFINIDSLEELLELNNEVGEIVLRGSTLFIYDDYIE